MFLFFWLKQYLRKRQMSKEMQVFSQKGLTNKMDSVLLYTIIQ